jgi:NAD(P)H-hydrate repair Nnr-like enzyme with NAD(P)H-hydrate epimerase domain
VRGTSIQMQGTRRRGSPGRGKNGGDGFNPVARFRQEAEGARRKVLCTLGEKKKEHGKKQLARRWPVLFKRGGRR